MDGFAPGWTFAASAHIGDRVTPKRPTRLAPLDNPDPEVEEILAKWKALGVEL